MTGRLRPKLKVSALSRLVSHVFGISDAGQRIEMPNYGFIKLTVDRDRKGAFREFHTPPAGPASDGNSRHGADSVSVLA